jgi:hypothetical protein
MTFPHLFTLPVLPTIATAATLHCLMGSIAAIVAHRKGRRLSVWLPVGLIAGTPALVVALLIRPQN